MKKNISINISGIIFHIEEDGYDTLRKYLDSINKYFANFEDSSEILADIESRVAEIFLSKLNEGKQVITVDDVNALVATMGSVNDFKAAEETDGAGQERTTQQARPNAPPEPEPASRDTGSRPYRPTQPLQRDQKRKIIGGVCSGIGNYFNVDPVWIRLLFGLLAFAYGITLLVYVVMWIVVPGSYTLEEPELAKKMFRDPERKAIGGVSGGVAAFFGMDIVAVRLLFVLFTIFFGVGFIIYIILWIALPEAKSITDRMEMQGEPVTLSNIESNIKKNLGETDKEESTATKILLFPFRLIGLLLSVLGKILVPLVEVIRVAIGIIVIIIGISFMLAAIVVGGVMIGLFSATAFSWPGMGPAETSLPLQVFTNSFSGWIVLAGFLGTIIPAVFITLLGSSIVAKKYVFGPTVGWTMFVLFFVSVAMLSVGIPKIVYSFKEEGEYKTEETFKIHGKTAVLKINEVGMDDYHVTHLTLKGYTGTDFKLVQTFKAQGATKQKAIENAHMVSYNVDVQDSTVTFDSNLQFTDDAVFRAQRLDMTLYIPYNFPFIMDEHVSRFISQYVDEEKRDSFTWTMTEKGLVCETCPKSEEEENQIADEFGLRDFNELEISGMFDVHVKRGDDYAVEMIGPDNEKSKYKIFRSGDALVIRYESKKKFKWNSEMVDIDEMRINITMPQLEKIEAEGYGKVQFENFESENMSLEVRGPVKVRGDLNVKNLVMELTGKSEVELSGRAHNLDAEILFASKLRAYNLEVQDAVVEVNGASSAKVNVSGNLEIEEGLASDVDYRGNPAVVKKD
ncbi:PspC domain-containing protein [Chryseolinea lacunae]|uniref:PspC domain-containing protein n=1 Tax=Chryseolinea lacunae TaxID=2801331 RepID=A0ABS1KU77_9BACT|nr:PspC domain-containing protein [Chryseolinea lacunae]MBL0742797.1 PspC domain-containing protein [Chryseolinea lacunae]